MGAWRDGRLVAPFRLVGEATVIHVDLTPDAAREAKAMGWLDESEHSRWRRFQFAGPRRRFSLCRAALRAILCRRLGARMGSWRLRLPGTASRLPR